MIVNNSLSLDKHFYILQSGLNRYFRELSNKQEVMITNKVLEATLFNEEEIANKFKLVLSKYYDKDFVIIKI